ADPHACEDLAQETYLRALTSLSRFAGRSSARTWLLSIARRVVVDRYRMAAARPRTLDLDDWLGVAEGAQPVGLPGFDEGVALVDLLTALAPARREMFLLTQVLGLPYADAATATGCPIGTVRSRVARAREDITALLAAAEKAAEPVPLAG
ncbi:sigma-70 family RNA polymerase sigma factor, partial [Streptomyces sp. MCAF7]